MIRTAGDADGVLHCPRYGGGDWETCVRKVWMAAGAHLCNERQGCVSASDPLPRVFCLAATRAAKGRPREGSREFKCASNRNIESQKNLSKTPASFPAFTCNLTRPSAETPAPRVPEPHRVSSSPPPTTPPSHKPAPRRPEYPGSTQPRRPTYTQISLTSSVFILKLH